MAPLLLRKQMPLDVRASLHSVAAWTLSCCVLGLCLLTQSCVAQVPAVEYFLNAYTSPMPEGCQVATLGDFQSAEFAAQYNRHGGSIRTWNAIPAVTDCAINVLDVEGGAPFRLMANATPGAYVVTFTPITGPYEGCFSGTPYTERIAFGTSMRDGNTLWGTLTPETQALATTGPFYAPGSVAILRCGGPTPPPSPPPPTTTTQVPTSSSTAVPASPAPTVGSAFGFAPYRGGPIAGCSFATLLDFQSDTFRYLYNEVGALPALISIPTTTSCDIVVLDGHSGAPGLLVLNKSAPRAAIVTAFDPTTGRGLCRDDSSSTSSSHGASGSSGGPVFPSMIALGSGSTFRTITSAMQAGAAIYDSGNPEDSIVVVKCG